MNIGNITSDNFNLDGNGKDIQIEVYEQLIEQLQQENQQQNQLLKDKGFIIDKLMEENRQLKDKLSKIETLIINHNCDTGDIYYKYNSKFLKSELKQRILEILYEQGSDSNE